MTSLRHRQALRRVYGLVRRTPGLRSARRRTVKALRKSPGARRLAQQIFAVGPSRRGHPIDVGAGNLLGGLGAQQLPVLLVVMIGTPSQQVRALVDEVAELQVLYASFRPVFVVDVPTFGPIRRYGYPVELLTPRHEWGDPEVAWEEYLSRRLGSIRRHFRSAGAVRVGPGGFDAIDRAMLVGEV